MPKFVRQGNNTLVGNNTFTGTNTFSGSLVASGGVTGNVTGNLTGNVTGTVTGYKRPTIQSALVGATVVLTAADSGKVFQNRSTSGSPSWTLPTAADGLWFTFVCANATAGFTVTGGTIKGKTNASGTAISGTTLTNTQGTAVVGDTITLVCDGTAWWMTAQSGTFAAS
jgi:hypothetical protein